MGFTRKGPPGSQLSPCSAAGRPCAPRGGQHRGQLLSHCSLCLRPSPPEGQSSDTRMGERCSHHEKRAGVGECWGHSSAPPAHPYSDLTLCGTPRPQASSKGLLHVGLPGGEMPVDLIVAWLPRGSSLSSIALGASTEAGERRTNTPLGALHPRGGGNGPSPSASLQRYGAHSLRLCLQCSLAGCLGHPGGSQDLVAITAYLVET